MENNKKIILFKLYNIAITILAITSIVFAVLDIFGKVNSQDLWYIITDSAILIIFAIDYIVRFILSHKGQKWSFFKHNFFDLLAIIPFDNVFSFFRFARLFRLAKLARFTKFAKLTKLTRMAGVTGKLHNKIQNFLKTNGFIYMVYCSGILILISSVLIAKIEHKSFMDALWWSIVTTTTVGYGDISPATGLGRFIAVILMIFGIGFISMLTGTITSYFAESVKKDKPKVTIEGVELTEEQQEQVLFFAYNLNNKKISK